MEILMGRSGEKTKPIQSQFYSQKGAADRQKEAELQLARPWFVLRCLLWLTNI